MSEKNIVESVLESVVTPQPVQLSDYSAPILIAHEKQRILPLEQYLEKPVRLKQRVRFNDVSGFTAYVNEFKGDETVLFANPKSITAVFDYHRRGEPSWCEHEAIYSLDHSVQWTRWAHSEGRDMTHEDFAYFIEEMIETIDSPPAGDLLSVVRQFKTTSNSKHVSVLNDNGGTASLEFRKDVNIAAGSNEIEFPKELTVVLRPYDGIIDAEGQEQAYKLRVRLKYKVRSDNTGVSFSYSILGFEKAQKEAFDNVVATIKAAVDLKTFVGGSLG